VDGESLHSYLAFSNEDYAKPDGMIYHNYPALKSPRDRAALWIASTPSMLEVDIGLVVLDFHLFGFDGLD